MNDSFVLFEVSEAIATISLNDAERLNPLGDEVIRGLMDAVGKAGDNKQVKAILLTGRGRGFCVGADLAQFRQVIDTPPDGKSLGQYVGELMARMNPVLQALSESPVPVVCAVNGVAAGGGAGLALAADLTVAAKSSYFYLPFMAALGAVPDMGLTWRLPRAIGHARALGLALTGEKLSAQKALEWGLIWACFEDDQIEAESVRLARKLSEIPRHAILEARALFAAGERNLLPQQLHLERARQIKMADGESFAKGVRAFTKKPC